MELKEQSLEQLTSVEHFVELLEHSMEQLIADLRKLLESMEPFQDIKEHSMEQLIEQLWKPLEHMEPFVEPKLIKVQCFFVFH